MAMYPLTLSDIASATGGKFFGDGSRLSLTVSGVTHDSRKVTEGSLFVCIKGARADGHDFAPAAFEYGALCALAERPLPDGRTYILVDSVMDALRRLAAFYRKRLPIPVVGIIGSVGKTTAKEMTAAVLSRCYRVLKTPANLNNELGVPLTLLSIGQEHDIAVIEMGISDFGEMTRLSYMTRPDAAVFTNVGCCHLERLGDLNGVLKAKTEVFKYMDYDAIAIMNGDDELLRGFTIDMQKVTFGLSEGCDFRAVNVENMGFEGISCDICNGFDKCHVTIPAFGSHMVYAALAAAIVGQIFFVPPHEIAHGIADYRTIAGRANIIKTPCLTLIDDCYNANPTSMSASLRSLAGVEGRRVAILGDMKELADSAALHRQMGALAAQLGIDLLLTVGTEAENIHAAFAEASSNTSRHFSSKEELYALLPEVLSKGDTVLVKASHSMGFEEIVKKLEHLDA